MDLSFVTLVVVGSSCPFLKIDLTYLKQEEKWTPVWLYPPLWEDPLLLSLYEQDPVELHWEQRGPTRAGLVMLTKSGKKIWMRRTFPFF